MAFWLIQVIVLEYIRLVKPRVLAPRLSCAAYDETDWLMTLDARLTSAASTGSSANHLAVPLPNSCILELLQHSGRSGNYRLLLYCFSAASVGALIVLTECCCSFPPISAPGVGLSLN